MLDDTQLGGFVDVLNSRRLLCSILSACLFIGVSACSEPDERLPWPTLAEKKAAELKVDLAKLPASAFQNWLSNCKDLINSSHKFEVSLHENGEFDVVEYLHTDKGCTAGAVHGSSPRKGKIDSVEALGDDAWKVKAHLYPPFNDGDLVSASIMMKMVDGQAYVEPLDVNMFDIADQVPKPGAKDKMKDWVFSPLGL